MGSLQNPNPYQEPRNIGKRQIFLELSAMFVVALAIPVIVLVDMTVLSDKIHENSLTEAGQLMFLAFSTMLYLRGAVRLPAARGYLAGAATLSIVMCLRECDGLFDMIAQGFWVYPVILCAVSGGVIVWRNRATTGIAFRRHYATRHGTLVFLGLVVLIVFSRTFGSGELWRPIMGDVYDQYTKGAIQEGIELLGYAIIAFGTFGSARSHFGMPPGIETADESARPLP